MEKGDQRSTGGNTGIISAQRHCPQQPSLPLPHPPRRKLPTPQGRKRPESSRQRNADTGKRRSGKKTGAGIFRRQPRLQGKACSCLTCSRDQTKQEAAVRPKPPQCTGDAAPTGDTRGVRARPAEQTGARKRRAGTQRLPGGQVQGCRTLPGTGDSALQTWKQGAENGSTAGKRSRTGLPSTPRENKTDDRRGNI